MCVLVEMKLMSASFSVSEAAFWERFTGVIVTPSVNLEENVFHN